MLVALLAVGGASGCDTAEPACHDSLPDLDGDGVQSEEDCALAEEAQLTKRICDLEQDLWRTADDCAVEDTLRIDNIPAAIDDVSVRLIGNDGTSTFVVTARDAFRVLTAPDQPAPPGQNGPLHSKVWQISEVPGSWGRVVTGTARGWQYRLASTDTSVWFEEHDGAEVTAAEITDMRPIFGDQITLTAVLSRDPGYHRLVAVVSTAVSIPGVLIIWLDSNDDATVDAGETIEIENVNRVLGLQSDWIAYQTFGQARYLRLQEWPPDPSRAQPLNVDASCDTYLGAEHCLDRGANRIVSYDDSGTATTAARLPAYTKHVDFLGRLHVQMVGPPSGASAWEDDDRSFDIREDEIADLRRTGRNYLLDSSMRRRPAWGDIEEDLVGVYAESVRETSDVTNANIIAWRRRRAHRFLGDVCSAEHPCAKGLTCGDSNSTEMHCVQTR